MGAGRPCIEIDWEEFEKLCGLHCTQVEIAEWFNCDPDTIQNHCKKHYGENFSDVFKKKSSKGKISLRRKMFELAVGGNVTMCIFLSKNILGFSDKVENVDKNDKVLTLRYSLGDKNKGRGNEKGNDKQE